MDSPPAACSSSSKGGATSAQNPAPSAGRLCRYRFKSFELNPQVEELRKGSIRIRLQDQPLRILIHLIENRARLVTRQELQKLLWPQDTFVDFEDGLNRAVKKLRDALSDDSASPRYIETIPRRGYRFIAEIEEIPEPQPAKVAPERPELEQLLRQTAALAWEGERRRGERRKSPDAASSEQDPAPSSPQAVAGSQPAAMIDSGANSRGADLPGAGENRSAQAAPAAAARFWRNRRLTVLAPATAALILLAAAYGGWRMQRHTTSAAPPIRSIAVLPFDNFSGDASQDYLAEGMTDELTTDLAQLGSVRVISRSSVMHYQGSRKTIPEIRQELGVDAVVEGSVARSQGSIRVDAQLIETADDRHIWAQTFTENEQNILGIEDHVSQSIAERVAAALNPGLRARLGTVRSVNAEAYEDYLHGLTLLAHHSDADLLKSLDYFKKSTALDATFGPAYAMRGYSYALLGDYDVLPDKVVWPQAEMDAERALDLDSSIARAHEVRALALWRYEWEWKEADSEFRRALQLNPNDADAHHFYAIFLATRGDFSGSEQQLQTARELDPLSLIIRTNVGWISYFQRDYPKAIASYQSVLQTDPRFYPAVVKLWQAYALAGDRDRAIKELEFVFRGWGYAGVADRIAAQARTAPIPERFNAELRGFANSGYLTRFEKARYLAIAGDNAAALSALSQAAAARDSWLVYAPIDPAFDSLAALPDFQRLMAAIHATTRGYETRSPGRK